MLAAGALLQGRYKIQEPLSEGGMSIVYLAEDAVLGNRVAIKEMKDHYLSPQERVLAAQQFLKEARILANLEHPGLPRVTNFFEQDGRHYLVMDYIAGDTLEALLNQQGGSLAEDVVLRIGIGAARVLDYLHSLQPAVIFRDLKPSNIMMARSSHMAEDERGRLKLIDFGISKIFDATQGTHTIIKGAGTPGYAPPEQYGAQGRMRTDARSDIYSLGATTYSLLTGQIPTEATDRWMNGEVLPPPRQLNSAVSAEIEALVLQMMELKPDLRPSSAREVIERLSTILQSRGRGTGAPSAGASGAAKPVRRFRSSIAGPGMDGVVESVVESDESGPTVEEKESPPAPAFEVAAPVGSAPSPPASVPVFSPPAPPLATPFTPSGGSAAAPPWSQPAAGTDAAFAFGAVTAPPATWPAGPLPPSQGGQGLGGSANPTMLGRPRREPSPILPILLVIAVIGIAFAVLSAFDRLPFGHVTTPAASTTPLASPSPAPGASSTTPAPRPSPTATVALTRLGLKVSPSGAKVFIDDAAAADGNEQTLYSTVTPGTHTVKVRKNGYLSSTIKVDALAQKDTPLEITLVKEATLRVTVMPPNAKIMVDEVYRGQAPLTLRSLAAGNHRYKVYAQDHITETGTIKLAPGQDANLALRLDAVHVAAPPPVYSPPATYNPPPTYTPPVSRPAPPVFRPEPRATSVDVPAPRATPR